MSESRSLPTTESQSISLELQEKTSKPSVIKASRTPNVRALLHRGIEITDGAYLERREVPLLALEEILRGWSTRLALPNSRQAKRFLQRVNQLETKARAHEDEGLRQELQHIARQMHKKGLIDALVAQAFAIVREAARRSVGKRHHDVQLLAGHALLQGKIAEMATGEGKTLAGTLAVCTLAATGCAVHVVTVNDYLAERDAEENQPLFDFFGFSLGIVKQDMPLPDRQAQYAADIVYVSNKELTFDYLKDRLSVGTALKAHQALRQLHTMQETGASVLRGLHVAIVDEADSVLIDEARTPLIISETLPDDLDVEVYQQAITIASELTPELEFIKGKDRDIWLTPAGHDRVREKTAGLEGVWKSALWQKELVQKALSALHMFERDQHYIIAENKVQIVDEFTGRVMPDRTWERGLHQMIEAKENCDISGQRKTLSQITYQRFFSRYLLLAGMTGTAKEIEPELKYVYDLSVVRIPTHKPSRRLRLPNQVYQTSAERWGAVADRAVEIAAQGRSVLIGTRSVEASELLGKLFEARNIEHAVLNARQDKTEAEAIAQAGQAGKITVATNMAGRGTDIKLAPEVKTSGGLHVILTEFHESARVDRQLFGRSARQGDPGSAEGIICIEDELFQRYASLVSRWGRPLWFGRTKINAFCFNWLVKYAQSKAERENRKIRLDTIKRDRKWQNALGFVGKTRK